MQIIKAFPVSNYQTKLAERNLQHLSRALDVGVASSAYKLWIKEYREVEKEDSPPAYNAIIIFMSEAGVQELARIPKLAPNFGQRRAQHLDFIDKSRRGHPDGEHLSHWPYNAGIYPNNPLGRLPMQPDQEAGILNGVELRGVEPSLRRFLLKVLEYKKRDGIDAPVIALDFGGMYGISWIKLAKAMEAFVKQDQVVFVVTNLTVNPGSVPEEQARAARIGRAGDSQYNDFFIRNRHLVHFVELDSEGLRGKQILLPKKGRLQLFGNIDLIHEQATLGNSHIPDFDLAELGTSLSPYGIMLLDSNEGNTKVRESEAIKIGLENLQKRGLMKIILGNDKSYQLFATPKAPTYVNF